RGRGGLVERVERVVLDVLLPGAGSGARGDGADGGEEGEGRAGHGAATAGCGSGAHDSMVRRRPGSCHASRAGDERAGGQSRKRSPRSTTRPAPRPPSAAGSHV